jgi:integrase
MDKVKKSGKMRYWIAYRINGKQRFEYSGTDFEQAKASDGKRSCQKAEGRILDILQTSKMTFRQISEWYLSQTAVTRLKSFQRVKIGIENFNAVYGETIVSSITKDDLIKYQDKRKSDVIKRMGSKNPGTRTVSLTTIDTEIMLVKAMINYAFMEDKIDGTALKVLRRIKKQVRPGTNARTRILSAKEYHQIVDKAPDHIKAFIVIAMNTGLRLGEIRQLQWYHIDKDKCFIRLQSGDTKEKKPKVIPINHNVKKELEHQLRWIRHDYVLTYHGEPIVTPGGIKHGFQTAVKAAGILHGRDVQNGLIFHDIRRTVKSLMLKAKIDKVLRDMILGHALLGMDKHYMVATEDELMKAMVSYTSFADENLW